MTKSHHFNIEKYHWHDIRATVKRLYPVLAKEIDKLSPGKQCRVYRIQYDFGDEIIHKGIFQLPNQNGSLTPITHPSIPKSIYNDLNYNFGSNPVSLVTTGRLELFIDLKTRVIPYQLIAPGDLFGLWKILDPTTSHCPPLFCWGLTSGARSLFMLPKLSDAISHKRLQKALNIKTPKPQKLIDEWEIFRNIYQHSESRKPWQTELLCFSKDWFKQLNDPAWLGLKNLFLESAWKSSQFWRNQYIWNLTFTRIQHWHNIKPHTFIDSLVRHIFAVSVNALPGFSPAIDNTWGPIDLLQQTYLDTYQLKQYQPIIMHPKLTSELTKNANTIYLSMHYPSSLDMSPRHTTRLSTIEDILELVNLITLYQKNISDEDLGIDTTPLAALSKTKKIDLYHHLHTEKKSIKSIRSLKQRNPIFSSIQLQFPGREFPSSSGFFKGCIGIESLDLNKQ